MTSAVISVTHKHTEWTTSIALPVSMVMVEVIRHFLFLGKGFCSKVYKRINNSPASLCMDSFQIRKLHPDTKVPPGAHRSNFDKHSKLLSKFLIVAL